MENNNLMSVQEMIERAFGRYDSNTVSFKLIQTILFLLARQLRILGRQVEVVLPTGSFLAPSSSISVTEVKLEAAIVKKKRKKKETKGKAPGQRDTKIIEVLDTTKSAEVSENDSQISEGSDKILTDRKKKKDLTDFEEDEHIRSTVRSRKDKSPEHAGAGRDKKQADSKRDKSFDRKHETRAPGTVKTSKATYDAIDGTTTTTKTIGKSKDDKNVVDNDINSKYVKEKTTVERPRTRYDTEKSFEDKDASRQKKDAHEDKRTIEDNDTKLDSGRGKISKKDRGPKTFKSSSSPERVLGTDEKPLAGSRIKPGSESSKGKTRKSVDYEQTSMEMSTTSKGKKTLHKKSVQPTRGKQDQTDFSVFLESVEEERERELRVINQRRDSMVESKLEPTPMASMDSIEKQYEKLLVVERVPIDAAKKATGYRSKSETRTTTPRISIVTQDQFTKLVAAVKELQFKFGTADFPENAELMQQLRRGASLTDAMAALQLSARLDATEKTLEKLLSLVTDLATKTPGIDLSMADKVFDNDLDDDEYKALEVPQKMIRKKAQQKLAKRESKKSVQQISSGVSVDNQANFITFDELDNAMQSLHDKLLKYLNIETTNIATNAAAAIDKVKMLEQKIEASEKLQRQMKTLEVKVSDFADQINTLDTDISSQMTSIQEQLTQLEYDLEMGLEDMAETLANAGSDTAAIADLNSKFTSLQKDFDFSMSGQTELKDVLTQTSLNLQELWKQLEILKDTKCDRDEVEDALKDKAGIGDLNGIVSQHQFEAVRGDFEKRVGAAYDKFNNQEYTWQKVIDELQREINEKADYVQLASLRDDVQNNIEMLHSKIKAMMEIVGEPRAAAATRIIHRDTTCLCCSAPVHMALEEPGIVPALPAMGAKRHPTIEVDSSKKPKEDGDHGVCYPGHPIPHPPDPRSHICQRYCGGSHTIVARSAARAPPVGMTVSPMSRLKTTEIGLDGKVYNIDKEEKLEPCIPCNVALTPKSYAVIAESESEAKQHGDFNSDMTPPDFGGSSLLPSANAALFTSVSVTPPPPIDED